MLQEFQNTLIRFKQDEDKWENGTKSEYIKKCGELVEAQIIAKLIDIEIDGISTYLYKKLGEFGISVTQRTIQTSLPDSYKRNYSKSETASQLTEDKWEKIETENLEVTIEKNQFNEFKINGIEVKNREAPRTTTTITKTTIDPKDTDQYKFLSALVKLSNKIGLTLESVQSRYNESDSNQEIIDAQLGDVKIKMQEYAKTWALIENSKGMIDLRRSWGEYEKVMGTFMIETGITIAKIAKTMDYSEKYGSIGLLREPRVRAFFETVDTFPLYLRSCPKCFTDISQTMNENIILYRECKDLNIDIPVIKFNQAKIPLKP